MQLADFDFELPPERIATRPAEPRESARLLVVGPNDGLTDARVGDLADWLRPGDLLVANDTKVIPARLFGTRPRIGGAGARIELLLHRRLGPGSWAAFARPAKRLVPGDRVVIADDLVATVVDKGDDGEVGVDFGCDDATLFAALERWGNLPLPPYILAQRDADDRDRRDYQTVFADQEGSVAAPTAGLHFTSDLLARIEARGVRRLTVTLHVGAGTFLPVKTERIAEHRMHAEWGEVTADVAAAINATRATGGRIVAVGTTATRLLESAACEDGTVMPFSGETAIFITPGYKFRAVDVLMTNFHLPKSTLFMLVCAFAGMDRMKRAYAHAVADGYRFYSYGDASLLHRIAA